MSISIPGSPVNPVPSPDTHNASPRHISLPRHLIDNIFETIRENQILGSFADQSFTANSQNNQGVPGIATLNTTEVQDILSLQLSCIFKLREDLNAARKVMAGEMERHDQMILDWTERAAIQLPKSSPAPSPLGFKRPPLRGSARRGRRGSWTSGSSCCLSDESCWEDVGQEGNDDEGDLLIRPDSNCE